MTVARGGRRKAAAAQAAASAAATAAGGAVAADSPWDDGLSFQDSAGRGVAEPVSEGLVRTDGGDMRSPSSSAAAASVAFSSRLSRRSVETRGDGGSRRSSSRRSDGGKGSCGSSDFAAAGRVPSRPLVAGSNRRDLARDDLSDSYASEHDNSSDQSSDSSVGSSDDSASVHEVDLPDLAEPASVFPQLMGAVAGTNTPGPSGASTTTRPPVAPLCDDQTNAKWLSDGGGGQPLFTTLSVVLSPASGSAQEPLALRDMGMAGRGRHCSDAPSAQPAPVTGGSSVAMDPAAVAPTAGEVAGSGRRKSHRSHRVLASSSNAQPPPSPVNISPRERSRSAWDASPVSPHRSATPLSPRHRGRRCGGSAALSRRGASVDLLPPSVVVSLDMRASSYAEEAEGPDHEDSGVFLSSQASSPLAAAIHASQLVGAGNRFSIASKMRRSPKAVPTAAIRDTGVVGEDMGVSRSLSTTSNQSGGGGGGAETSSGGLQQRLMGGTRRSGGGADGGGGERPSTSSGGTFRRAPKHSTLGRPSSPDAPSSASRLAAGSSAAASTAGTGVVPLSLAPGTAGNATGAPPAGTGKAIAAGSKPFFRRFSNARPSASGTSARARGDTSAGGGGPGVAAGRPSADGSSLSGTSTFGATDRGTPVATGGAACVSPVPFSPSEEACPSSNGTTTSTLASAGARSRRKIAKVFFSRKAAAGTPSSSSFLSGSSAGISTPFTGAQGGPGGAGGAEEDESCTAFTAAVPPSTALAAVSRVLLSAGCDMSVKRDRTVKVKVDAPLGGGLHLHVNVLLEGVAVAGDPPGTQQPPTTYGEGTSAETGSGEAQVISATLVRLVRSRDDRGRTPQSEFVAFFHDFHYAFVQATLSRGGP